MTSRDENVERLLSRIRRAKAADDTSMLFGDSVQDEVRALHSDDPSHPFVALALGELHWQRFRALPFGHHDFDLRGAVVFFAQVGFAIPRSIRMLLQEVDGEEVVDPAAWHEKAVDMLGEDNNVSRLVRIDHALSLIDLAVHATPHTDGDSVVKYYSSAASAFNLRYEITGDASDIDSAVAASTHALHHASPEHPSYGFAYATHALMLNRRFAIRGDRDDLDESIRNYGIGIESCERAEGLFMLLHNRAASLLSRYLRFGNVDDLSAAIASSYRALETSPPDSDRGSILSTIATEFRARFERTGDIEDCERSVSVAREAVQITSRTNPDFAGRLYTLSAAISQRFDRKGDQVDLNESITLGGEAVGSAHKLDPDRGMYLMGHALSLHSRFLRSNERADIEASVLMFREAAAISDGEVERAQALSGLANALWRTFEFSSRESDLSEAYEVASAAAACTPTEDTNRARMLCNLAYIVELCKKRQVEAPADPLLLFREAAESDSAPPYVRLTAARHWLNRSAAASDLVSALDAGELATSLVPLVSGHELATSSQRHHLETFHGVASEAAACAIATGAPSRALDFLAEGRGGLLSRALGIDLTDLRDLHSSYPRLADKVQVVNRDILALSAMERPSSLSGNELIPRDSGTERRRLVGQWNDVLAEVRSQTGFEGFLRRAPFGKISTSDHPVVVLNVADMRCDAIILAGGDPHVVPLVDASLTRIDSYRRLIRDSVSANDWGTGDTICAVLEDIWNSIVGPIFEYLVSEQILDTASGMKQRIWWAPTGPATMLPLHAAGCYRPGGRPEVSALDAFSSSYMPVLDIREWDGPDDFARPDSPLIVGVGMPAEREFLSEVENEIQFVRRIFPHGTTLAGDNASSAAILAGLEGCDWFHFAGHGMTDEADPANSHLVSADGKISVFDLASLNLSAIHVALLSACSTAVSSERLADESVHITGALHVAGVCNVIGTLWPIADAEARDVTSLLYRNDIVSQPAKALNQAQCSLRLDYPSRAQMWAAHVHVGR